MIQELAELRAELELVKQTELAVDQESLRTEVIEAKQIAQRAEKAVSGLTNTTSVTHLAGYAAAGYSDQEGSSGSFSAANFNPIFHFEYGVVLAKPGEAGEIVIANATIPVQKSYSNSDLIPRNTFSGNLRNPCVSRPN